MKKILPVLTVFFLFATAVSGADPPKVTKEETTKTVYYDAEKAEKLSICPKTLMKDQCLNCHRTGDFKVIIKESELFETFKPPYQAKWIRENGKDILKFSMVDVEIGSATADRVDDFFVYAKKHDQKHVIIEVMSPGGSLFHGWRIVGLMQQFEKAGNIIETRCYGWAASAASLIFASGTLGHRFASETAELMYHELWTFEFLKLSTPSDKEDEARILRHLQDNCTNWLVGRSKLTKEEWDQRVKKKEFWCNGKEAFEIYGVSDGLL